MSINIDKYTADSSHWRGILDGEGTFMLPRPDTRAGAPRKVGIEVEFADLEPESVARCVMSCLGGTARDVGHLEWRVEGTALGEVRIFRDVALRKKGGALMQAGLRLAGDLIPLELVTDPVDPQDFGRIESLFDALRERGATGTREGFMHGYGLHLNPEVPSLDATDVVPVVRAFALMEDWLRQNENLTEARRLLPFIEPWPPGLVDRLSVCEATSWGWDELIDAYLAETRSRNHSLDMLPLFLHVDEEGGGRMGLKDKLPDNVGARPTYHYRLPESRVDEVDWTLAREWNSWVIVERVAANPALISALSAAWQAHRASVFDRRKDWAQAVAHLLAAPLGSGPQSDTGGVRA